MSDRPVPVPGVSSINDKRIKRLERDVANLGLFQMTLALLYMVLLWVAL